MVSEQEPLVQGVRVADAQVLFANPIQRTSQLPAAAAAAAEETTKEGQQALEGQAADPLAVQGEMEALVPLPAAPAAHS